MESTRPAREAGLLDRLLGPAEARKVRSRICGDRTRLLEGLRRRVAFDEAFRHSTPSTIHTLGECVDSAFGRILLRQVWRAHRG